MLYGPIGDKSPPTVGFSPTFNDSLSIRECKIENHLPDVRGQVRSHQREPLTGPHSPTRASSASNGDVDRAERAVRRVERNPN